MLFSVLALISSRIMKTSLPAGSMASRTLPLPVTFSNFIRVSPIQIDSLSFRQIINMLLLNKKALHQLLRAVYRAFKVRSNDAAFGKPVSINIRTFYLFCNIFSRLAAYFFHLCPHAFTKRRCCCDCAFVIIQQFPAHRANRFLFFIIRHSFVRRIL